jgi:hypothetical protein
MKLYKYILIPTFSNMFALQDMAITLAFKIPNACPHWVIRHSSKPRYDTNTSSWMALQPLWALAYFQFPDLFFYNRQDSLNEWSAHRKASTETLDGKWAIILLRGPLGTWGSSTCSKFTTRVKRLKVPPGGLVPWIFPSLKIRRPPPGLNPHRSNATSRLRRPLMILTQSS